jgi:hypothetical protein
MLGKKNQASLIEFNPLKGTPFNLPDHISNIKCKNNLNIKIKVVKNIINFKLSK